MNISKKFMDTLMKIFKKLTKLCIKNWRNIEKFDKTNESYTLFFGTKYLIHSEKNQNFLIIYRKINFFITAIKL